VTLEQRAGLAQRLVDAHETERRNLARELHDELAQCLSAMCARATLLAQMAAHSSPALVGEARAIGSVGASTLARLRDTLVRLRPPELDEVGLVDSIEKMVQSWGTDHRGIDCRFQAHGAYQDLSMPVAVSLYRIAQECLTNVGRHAAATRVEVILTRPERGRIQLIVRDDGLGWSPGSAATGLGMVGMQERVAALRGDLHVDGAGEQGFAVTVRLPVPEALIDDAQG
jgi:signal transduction histidine kinase